MRKRFGRAAALAARPLSATIAGAVVLTGLLTAPASASVTSAPRQARQASHITARLHTELTRSGLSPSNPARTGGVTGVIRSLVGTSAGLCVAASGAAGHVVARTDASGRYVLTGLRQGRYSLTVASCAGPTAATPTGTLITSPLRSVTVRPGRIDTIPASSALRLGAGGLLMPASRREVTVQSAGAGGKLGRISGTITHAGHALSGICAVALSARRDRERIAVSGKSGRYQIGHLAPGKYVVEFGAGIKRCPNTGNWLTQVYPHHTTVEIRHLTFVHVHPGKDTGSINADMRVGGQISGTVRSASGKPVGRICVLAGGRTKDHKDVEMFAPSVSSGRYVLHGIFPGTYKVLFSLGCGNTSNFASQWWRDTTKESKASRITISGQRHAAGIDASLRPGAVITGTVRAKTAEERPSPASASARSPLTTRSSPPRPSLGRTAATS